MTSESSSLSSLHPAPSAPIIQTANGSSMSVSHIGHVSTSNLTLPYTYFIPQLELNLISVGQLCDLGLDIHFSASG